MKQLESAVLAGFLLLLTLEGCGYRLEGKETSLPKGIQTISIPTLANQTVEPGIENIFTRALIQAFNLDRRLQVVAGLQADSILEGSIRDFSISSISYDTAGHALEYRAQVTMSLTFRRTDTGQVLWQAPYLQEQEDYRVTAVILTDEASKQVALNKIALQLAQTIRDRILERF